MKLRAPEQIKALADLDTCETCGAKPGQPCDPEYFSPKYSSKEEAKRDQSDMRATMGMRTIRFYNGVDLGAVYHRGRLRNHVVEKEAADVRAP